MQWIEALTTKHQISLDTLMDRLEQQERELERGDSSPSAGGDPAEDDGDEFDDIWEGEANGLFMGLGGSTGGGDNPWDKSDEFDAPKRMVRLAAVFFL